VRAAARIVRRLGTERAARALDRSPAYLRRVVAAAEGRIPLGVAVPGPRAREQLVRRVEAAVAGRPSLRRDRALVRDVQQAHPGWTPRGERFTRGVAVVQREPPQTQYRTRTWRFLRREEVERKAADYVAAGVQDIKIWQTPRGWRIATIRAERTPGRRRR
jgi:hypothetical protein